MSQSKKHFRIGILVYPGCLRSGALLPHDIFALANTLMQARPKAQLCQFEALWLSARGKTSEHVEGITFATEALAGQQLDALMLPGIAHQSVDDIVARLLLSSCSATCLLAHTGLLDGRRSTTSW